MAYGTKQPDETPSRGDGPPHANLNWADANSGFIEALKQTSNAPLLQCKVTATNTTPRDEYGYVVG